MINFLAKRRFNYIDLIGLTASLKALDAGRWGIFLLISGVTIIASVEMESGVVSNVWRNRRGR